LIKSGEKLTSANIKTLVYPGFPTDLQQPLTALLTKAEGTSVITDTIYSARVKHIDELRRMNAKIKVEGGSIVIDGPVQLEGARLEVSHLRAGAAHVIEGLMAEDQTKIYGIEHIEHEDEKRTEKEIALDAKIHREELNEKEMIQLQNN